MNLKNLTQDAKVDLFKQLVSELELANIASEDSDFQHISIGSLVDEAVIRREWPEKSWGILTNYPLLDKALGGFANGEMIVLSGASGKGKSLFAQSIMLNMALDNVPCLFFTLEMPAIDSTDRFVDMAGLFGGSEVLKDLPIYFHKSDKISLRGLDDSIKHGKESGIKIVFIDHLHFFSHGGDNMASEIGHIVREIKLMALKYEVPIVLISHIRKTGTGAMPNLDDLKDSSGIAQDADTVIMINRNTEADNEEEQRIMKVKIRKNRRKGLLPILQYRLDEHNHLKEEEYGRTTIDQI